MRRRWGIEQQRMHQDHVALVGGVLNDLQRYAVDMLDAIVESGDADLSFTRRAEITEVWLLMN